MARRRFTALISTMATVAATIVIATGATVAGQLASAGPAFALDNGLARTPPMGFNDWNAFGCNVSEVLSSRPPTSSSFRHEGGRLPVRQHRRLLDDAQRDASGSLVPDPASSRTASRARPPTCTRRASSSASTRTPGRRPAPATRAASATSRLTRRRSRPGASTT